VDDVPALIVVRWTRAGFNILACRRNARCSFLPDLRLASYGQERRRLDPGSASRNCARTGPRDRRCDFRVFPRADRRMPYPRFLLRCCTHVYRTQFRSAHRDHFRPDYFHPLHRIDDRSYSFARRGRRAVLAGLWVDFDRAWHFSRRTIYRRLCSRTQARWRERGIASRLGYRRAGRLRLSVWIRRVACGCPACSHNRSAHSLCATSLHAKFTLYRGSGLTGMNSSVSPRQLLLALDHSVSFSREDFLQGPPNLAAFNLVERWPDWPDRVVALVGPQGSGKSHLAAIWAEVAGARVLSAKLLSHTDLPAAFATGALVLEDLEFEGLDERVLFHFLNLAREQMA